MKGYKAFNKDLTCRGFQYEIGKEFIHEGSIELCDRGFHFCKKIVDILSYYNLKDEDTRLCEIEATGKIIEDDNKCVTDKIKIIREISKEEMYMLGNEGIENRGLGNTGNRNTGYWNTGDSNTGGYNTGDSNTGDWNKTNRSTGVFCNKEPRLIMFNKETNMTWEEWENSEVYDILTRNVKSQWISYSQMTNEEKEKYPSAKNCGGYLKEIERSKSSKEWWKQLEMHEKATIIQLPNFDLDIFNDIMEFKITKEEYKEILQWLKSR